MNKDDNDHTTDHFMCYSCTKSIARKSCSLNKLNQFFLGAIEFLWLAVASAVVVIFATATRIVVLLVLFVGVATRCREHPGGRGAMNRFRDRTDRSPVLGRHISHQRLQLASLQVELLVVSISLW